MLLSLIVVPLIGSIIIIIGSNKGKLISLITSIINILLIITIYIKWNNNNVGYQIIENWWNIINLGIDSISLIMILLTSFVMCLSTLASWRTIQSKLFYFYITIMSSILMGVFLTLDLIPFYICFESSLIPMFLLIGTYGSNKERKIYAAFSIMLTTLIGSLIMLLAILSIYSYIGSNIYIIANDITNERQNILWLGLLAALGVKTPIIPLHLWLPEAHTEANISGSIILAGVLLKLATYGYLRLSIGLMPIASYYFTPLIYAISITSLIYSSLSTLRQIDLKKIIAYSSIGHMSIVNIGLFSNNLTGISGGLLLSFAHGIVSPALFLLVTFLYDRYHTRIINYYRGLNYFMPIYSLFLFLFILANMATPLTGNFNGELLIFSGSWLYNPISVIIAALGIILSAAYSIWFFNRISFGTIKLFRSYDITRFEFSLLLPCLFIIFIIGIYPNLLLFPYML
jgi:NADH-ubiquinone oxidoreductase chain 4